MENLLEHIGTPIVLGILWGKKHLNFVIGDLKLKTIEPYVDPSDQNF